MYIFNTLNCAMAPLGHTVPHNETLEGINSSPDQDRKLTSPGKFLPLDGLQERKTSLWFSELFHLGL